MNLNYALVVEIIFKCLSESSNLEFKTEFTRELIVALNGEDCIFFDEYNYPDYIERLAQQKTTTKSKIGKIRLDSLLEGAESELKVFINKIINLELDFDKFSQLVQFVIEQIKFNNKFPNKLSLLKSSDTKTQAYHLMELAIRTGTNTRSSSSFSETYEKIWQLFNEYKQRHSELYSMISKHIDLRNNNIQKIWENLQVGNKLSFLKGEKPYNSRNIFKENKYPLIVFNSQYNYGNQRLEKPIGNDRAKEEAHGSSISNKSELTHMTEKNVNIKVLIYTTILIILTMITILFIIQNKPDKQISDNPTTIVSSETSTSTYFDNERKSFSIVNPPSDVIFNSFIDSDNEYFKGDEMGFCLVREKGQEEWLSNIKVEVNKKYEIMNYYHNNSKDKLAENVFVSGEIPEKIYDGIDNLITSRINSNNSFPQAISSSVVINSDTTLNARYIPDTLTIRNNSKTNEQILDSLDFFTIGLKIGNNSLNGQLPALSYGAIMYEIETTAPNFDIGDFDISTEVAKENSREWNNKIYETSENIIECQIHFINTGSTSLKNVIVKLLLPETVEHVPGSTYISNVNTPDGVNITDSISIAGTNIGGYTPGSNAYIKVKLKVKGDIGDVLKITAKATTKSGTKSSTTPIIINEIK